MLLKRKRSFFRRISFKITMWYSLSVLVILAFAGTFLHYRLKHRLNKEAIHMMIDESHDVLPSTLENRLSLEDIKASIKRESSSHRYNQISARVLDADMEMVYTSTDFLEPFLRGSGNISKSLNKGGPVCELVRVESRSSPYIILNKPVFQDGELKYILQMSMYLRDVYKSSKHFRENLVMIIPALIIVSFAGGWFISRRSLAPVGEIIRSASEITSLNLDKRIKSVATGDELEELTSTINLMLDRLEEAFERIVQFTSDVSHELRTPIATLRAGTDIILGKKRTAEEYLALHENNLIEYEKISRMIDDLLTLLRSDSGRKILNLNSINLSCMVDDLSEKFMIIAGSKSVKFFVNNKWKVKIKGDWALLSRALCNLLDNAVKYTPSGGNVSVTIKDNGDEVLIIIKDTGVGIVKKDLGRIFDRFYRSDPSRSRNTGGSGLGLSIVKNIVELHNGRIEVSSNQGKGSVFTVTLPKKIKNLRSPNGRLIT